MKIRDIIDYYKHLREQGISPRYDWSYYEDKINKFLEQKVEIRKGVPNED